MTIALVILHADPARGGAERYTADLAGALAGRGHDVSILAADFGPAIPGVRFCPLACKAATRRGQYAKFLASLDRHLAGHSYDIVHSMLPVRRCDVYHPHAGLAVEELAAGHLKRATQWSQAASRLANRVNRKRRLFADVERELLNSPRPPVVLHLSNAGLQTIRRHYDLPPDRIALLFNGVDLNRFAPGKPMHPLDRRSMSIDDDCVVALMIAQNFSLKGLRESILALAEVAENKLLLLVVGRDDPGLYEQLAKTRKVAGQVRFAGQVSDPRPFYAVADFFVLPTRRDQCSLVVLEALATGLPVISTRANGACDIMEDGRHGFVLQNPRDVPALAEAMRKLLNADTRSAQRQACLALRPQLSFDSHVERLLSIYGSCSSFAQKSTAR